MSEQPEPNPAGPPKELTGRIGKYEIIKLLGVDTWYVRLNTPKTWQKARLDAYTIVDEWGVPWSKPPGSLYTSPVLPPLKNPTLQEIQRHPWPDPDEKSRFDGLRERTLRLFEETDYAIVADGLTGVGVFDMAWQRPPDQLVQGHKLIRDYHVDTSGRLTNCSVCHR